MQREQTPKPEPLVPRPASFKRAAHTGWSSAERWAGIFAIGWLALFLIIAGVVGSPRGPAVEATITQDGHAPSTSGKQAIPYWAQATWQDTNGIQHTDDIKLSTAGPYGSGVSPGQTVTIFIDAQTGAQESDAGHILWALLAGAITSPIIGMGWSIGAGKDRRRAQAALRIDGPIDIAAPEDERKAASTSGGA